MPTEAILTFIDESGRRRRVALQSKRFTIGRGPENDLSIDDSNLSRSQAVIEAIDGTYQISDRNSRNGTIVNGQPVVGTVALFDGDVITLGGSCDIAVAIHRAPVSSSAFTAAKIAAVAVAVILFLSAVLLTVNAWRQSGNSAANEQHINNGPTEGLKANKNSSGLPNSVFQPEATPAVSESDTSNKANATDQIVTAVKQVMIKISNDNAPYISEAGITDVDRKVKQYRGSAELAEKLRRVKGSCPELNSLATSINLKSSLLVYAALAESDSGSGGDPVAAARRMVPKLLTLRATFGTETANSSLLLIAAYPYAFNPPIGSQARTPHPLASKLVEFGGRKSTVDTSEARTVWFLREKDGITSEAYELVIKLLAIGIIAQNPRQYGIDADPLFC